MGELERPSSDRPVARGDDRGEVAVVRRRARATGAGWRSARARRRGPPPRAARAATRRRTRPVDLDVLVQLGDDGGLAASVAPLGAARLRGDREQRDQRALLGDRRPAGCGAGPPGSPDGHRGAVAPASRAGGRARVVAQHQRDLGSRWCSSRRPAAASRPSKVSSTTRVMGRGRGHLEPGVLQRVDDRVAREIRVGEGGGHRGGLRDVERVDRVAGHGSPAARRRLAADDRSRWRRRLEGHLEGRA